MLHPLNIIVAVAWLALGFACASLAVYYVLPPAGPGVTHVIDPATGEWRRRAWAKAAAPFYETGQQLRHHLRLPMKRLPDVSIYK